MAGKSNLSATLFAQKKLLGKANTSVVKSDSQEIIGSNIQVAAQTIFAEDIPDNPSQTLYLLQSASNGGAATVEWVQFDLSVISGTTYDANTYDDDSKIGNPQDAGPHAYQLALSASYESLSSNANKGNGTFDNSKVLHETLGALQIVPPNFSGQAPNPYILKLYKGTPSEANEIPLLDEIDWSIDYYNGILFLQDYDASKIPLYARGFIYTGKMLSQSLGSGGGGGSISGGANLGSGEGVFSAANGSNLEFKSLAAGSNISLSSNSNSITISSTVEAVEVSGVNKYVKIFESNVASGSAVTFSDFQTSFITTSGSLDVYHNGQLILSGNQTLVDAGNADYYLFGSNGLKLGFDIFADDILTLKQTLVSTGSADPTSGYILHTDDGSLGNARVLNAGDGISISTANPRQITVSNTGIIGRTKKFYDVTGSHAANNMFEVSGSVFSDVNYNPDLIDVFHNGQSLRSGSNHDYTLFHTGAINFKFDMFADDIVQVVIFK